MSDYLSPGVYIEELPPQLRAIEGVSTSTAGFVGAAARGAVPGFPLPFTPQPGDPQVVTLVPPPTPVLVTSYSSFTQQFGNALPLPDPTGVNYLGYAVLGFFNNGGQIVYIVRVAPSDASYGSLRLSQGNVLRLQTDALTTDQTLNFTAIRGLSNGATLSFFHKDGSAVINSVNANPLTATVSSYNAQTAPPTVTLSAPVGVPLAAADVYVIAPALVSPATDTLTAQGPTFWAQSPGSWSGQIAVTVTPSRRRAVSISASATSSATEIQVASTTGFYQGAVIEVDIGTQQVYGVVSNVGTGGLLRLKAALGVAVTASTTGAPTTARIVEIDISIVDPSLAVPITETYTQVTWNPDPNPIVRQRHYSTVINAQSQLVYVQPPGVGGASGSEDSTLATQPTTFNGLPFSIASASALFNVISTTITTMLGPLTTAAATLSTHVQTLAIQPLPVAAGDLSVTHVTTDALALSSAATTVSGLLANTGTAFKAAYVAAGAASDAIIQAGFNPPTVASQAQLATDAGTVNTQAGAIAALNLAAIAALNPALATVPPAVTTLNTAVSTLAAATLPVAVTDPKAVAVASAANALISAVTSAATGLDMAPGSPSGVGALAASVTTAVNAASLAVTAANDAIHQAEAGSGTQLAADEQTVETQVAAILLASTPVNAVAQIGSDGTATNIDYVGQDNGPGQRSGIQSLKDAESVSIIAAPGQTDQMVQNELINQCELLLYRFAVLDGEQNPAGGSVNAILAHRDQYDTSYAAYYVPWLQITLNNQNNQNVYIPPSGHMAGIYAGTDNTRGVWKAPANVVVQNITGLKTYIVKGEQDILNPAGVNAIRRFDTLGTRVWGARTLSSDSSLIYINVRRTLIYLEASIDQGTQWVVFEPNAPDTWDRLTDSVTAFLTTQWANGALFGDKPTDAFFVRCDETTMTADDIQNGRLICMIGVAIVRPAEFIIFRIQQTTGYANQ